MISTSILILGGGFHGTFLGAALKKYRRSKEHDFLILDPLPGLLASWFTTTSQTKVQFLRSSLSHSIAPNFHSLRNYALALGRTAQITVSEFSEMDYSSRENLDVLQPYFRPSLRLFNDHAREYIRSQKLEDYGLRGRAIEISPEKNRGYRVVCQRDEDVFEITAGKIILALGFGANPRIPENIDNMATEVLNPLGKPITPDLVKNKEVAVVGGGLSGGQVSIWALDSGAKNVTIYSLEPPSESRFDFDPCYVGPKCSQDFLLLSSAKERIDSAKLNRRPGTMTTEIFNSVLGFQERGKIRWDLGSPKGTQEPVFVTAGYHEPKLSLGQWIDSLPSYKGYPILKDDLSWASNLYVSGSLAISEIGPPAPNFIGAHLAARRILPQLGIDFGWRFDTRDEFQ